MLSLDIARGAFARLPLKTRLRLGHVVRHVPARLKFGGTYAQWRRRIARARLDPAFAAAQQDAMLVSLVETASETSPWYRDRLAEVCRRPVDARALRDQWHRLPILSGPDVVAHKHALCTAPSQSLDACITGGTSGQPVTFFLDRGRSPIEYAFVHDAWARTGFRANDMRAVFRGVEIAGLGHMHEEPALGELRCSVFHLRDAVMRGFLDAIERRGIAYLHGYPSALAIFADFVLRERGSLRLVRGILPASERLPAILRQRLARAFPAATIAPFYGLSEKVAFATECEDRPEDYAFDPLYGLTELVDADGHPVTEPGRQGRIVSTGLLFRGMPFIRYDTGDAAEMVEPASRANGHVLRVRNIVPRHSQDYVVGRGGTLIPISGFLQLDADIFDAGEFQFVQTVPGELTLRIVPRRAELPDLTGFLKKTSRKVAGQVAITIEIVDAIPTTAAGKRKFIDQRLSIALDAADVLADAHAPTCEPAC